jgi:hypothetical protein
MQWNDEEATQVTESMANNIQSNGQPFKFQSFAEYNGHLLQVPKVNLAERTKIKSLIITSVHRDILPLLSLFFLLYWHIHCYLHRYKFLRVHGNTKRTWNVSSICSNMETEVTGSRK